MVEYGKTRIFVDRRCPLFKGLDTSELVWMSHGDVVSTVPTGFKVNAITENGLIAGMCNCECHDGLF